jgi:hypothetical protein
MTHVQYDFFVVSAALRVRRGMAGVAVVVYDWCVLSNKELIRILSKELRSLLTVDRIAHASSVGIGHV